MRPHAVKRLVKYEALLHEMYTAGLGHAPRARRIMRGLYALVIQGFEGSYETVRRYIIGLKPFLVMSGYTPLEFDAGDALRLDWSHELVTLNGVDQKVCAAHFKLSYSPRPFNMVYRRESKKMVLDAFPVHPALCGFLGRGEL